MEQATFLKINPADSVVVCLQPKKKGEIIEVDGLQVMINQDTPAGHKVLITSRSQSTHQGCPRRYRYHQVWLPHRSCQGESEGRRLG